MFNVRKADVDAQFEEIDQSYETLEVETLTPHIGAKVRGIDLSQSLTNEQARDVHQAWIDWKVLVFPDQHLNRDQHKAFARRWGKLHVHPMQPTYGGDEEILVVKTTRNSAYTSGDGWHTDVTPYHPLVQCSTLPKHRRAVAEIHCLPTCTSHIKCSRIP